MLNREFSQLTNKMCQLQHKTLPPHIQFMQLKPDNALKQLNYLVKQGDVLPSQKKTFTQNPS